MRHKLLILGSITTVLMATLLGLTLFNIAHGAQGITPSNTALLFIAIYLTYRSGRYVMGQRRKIKRERALPASEQP